MQKLITIRLTDNDAGAARVEEHLAEYLADGWRVTSVCAAGAASGKARAGACVVAVLEKSSGAAWQGEAFSATQTPAPGLFHFAPLIELPQSEEGVPVEPSEVALGPDMPVEVGSRVLAYSQGRWWRAEVIGVEREGMVRIHFPGWDAKWDTVVPCDELQVDLNPPED